MIATRPPGYALLVEPNDIDAVRFERLTSQAHELLASDPARARQLIRDAMDMWRGPPLDDLTYEEFARPEIIRLEQLRDRAVEDRIEATLAVGDHHAVVGELAALTAQHPLRERLWGEYMVALTRCGRQAEALAAYQELARNLGEQLGIEPSAEIQQIEERILLQDPGILEPGTHGRVDRLRGYELRTRLGVGAFGEVWQAVQPGIGREVAVKVIRPDLANRPEFVRSFEAEARVLASLEHPNIVALFDFWRDPEGAYLVMPLLRGGNVAGAVRDGPLDPEPCLAVVAAVADALAYAHRHHVVHGDLTPENVLFDEGNRPYVADFGIASFLGDPATPEATSPGFRSPEQLHGEAPTPRSDVFGLGVLTHLLLTGTPRQPDAALPPVTTLTPEVAATVGDVLATATAPEPAMRYAGPEAFIAALSGALGSAPRSLPSTAARNPYKGLRAFGEADAADFFGRETLVTDLITAVTHHRLVGVVGPSGCGKSSLVRAGLLPNLRKGAVPGSGQWLIADLSPGEHPMAELEAALLGIATRRIPELPQLLTDPDTDPGALTETLRSDGGDVLLVIDQLEELFTLTHNEDERHRFIDLLTALTADPRSRIRVVVTLRADFYDRPLEYAAFGDALGRGLVSVATPTEAALARAVTGPATGVGVTLQPGLETEIVHDVRDQPGGLPLMEYALTELFARRSGSRITTDTYHAMGGVISALGRRAEELYSGYDENQRPAVRQIFLRLVQVAEDAADTRRRVPRHELTGLGIDVALVDDVLTCFGAHRLLTFDRDPTTRSPTVEVAHEALLTRWDRLHTWIDDRRDDLVLHRRLTTAVSEWLESHQAPEYFLTGGRLEHYEQFAAATDLALTEAEHDYLRESRRHADELATRRKRRRRAVLSGFAAAALVASLLAVFALIQRAESSRNATVARSRELAASAIAVADTDPELSLLLALESVKGGEPIFESVNALHRAVLNQRALLRFPAAERAEGATRGNWAALSPDGSLIVTSDRANDQVRVHDAATGAVLRTVSVPSGENPSMFPLGAFGAGSTEIVFFTEMGAEQDPQNLYTLDAATGALQAIRVDWPCPVMTLPRDGSGRVDAHQPIVVASVPISSEEASGPDAPIGDWQAFPSTCPEVDFVVLRIDRDAGTTEQLAEIDAGRAAYPPDWTISRDGDLLALNLDERATIMDLGTGATRSYGPRGPSALEVLSPDGTLLATIGTDRNDVWDLATDTLLWALPGRFTEAWFSVDSSHLVASHDGGSTWIWNARTGEELTEIHVPYATLLSDDALTALSPRTWGRVWENPQATEDSISVWNAGAVGEVAAYDLPRESRYTLADLKVESGRFIVRYGVTTSGGPVGVYDIASGVEVFHIATGLGDDIALSHDGRYVAVQDEPRPGLLGSVRIYDILTGTSVVMEGLCTWDDVAGTGPGCGDFPDEPFEAWVTALAFFPDGSKLIGGMWEIERGYPMLVWDTATGEVLYRLPPGMFAGRILIRPDWARILVLDEEWNLTALETEGWTEVGKATVDWVHESIAYTPDGRQLLVNVGEGMLVADADTFATVREKPDVGVVRLFVFNPSGTLVAGGHDEGMIGIYSFETLDVLQQIDIGEPIRNLAWLSDTHVLVTPISGPGIVVTTDVDELLEVARSRITRTFTASECAAYHIDPCPVT